MTFENRYARQIQLPQIGVNGQERIRNSRILILGVGALGTVAAELLARAGVGHLRLVDRDTVEPSNLQRQALFDEADAADQVSKVAAAAKRLSQINHQIHIEPIAADVNAQNIAQITSGCDLVIDATDNFSTRLLLNDIAIRDSITWIHGGCIGGRGQVALLAAGARPCFRCLTPETPDAGTVETCDTAGVLNAATHLIASLQTSEAIRWIVDPTNFAPGKLTTIDLWGPRFRTYDLDTFRVADCPACVGKRFDFLNNQETPEPLILCGRNAVQIPGQHWACIDFDKIARKWEMLGTVQKTPFLVRLATDGLSITLFRDGRAVISGTQDKARAKTMYSKYVGQ